MSLPEDRTKIERYAKEAIALATQGQWKEAVAANKAVLELSPKDVEAYNRLGKALMELGEYKNAQKAYRHALELDPYNSIAKKNLDRLSHLIGSPPTPRDHYKVALDIFIEETGKAGIVNLIHLAPKGVIAQMSPGEEVSLQVEGQRLLVRNGHGEYLGEVEPKYGMRLAKLMQGGNKYIAAISSLRENEVKAIIREVYQHPSQMGRLSFPLKRKEIFRPYIGESLLRYPLEEEPAEEVDVIIEAEREGFTVTDLDEASISAEEDPEPGEENGDRDS